jgi:Fe-S-cluster containining protein
MIDCSKCLAKCKAICCGIVPFDPGFIAKHKTVREVVNRLDISDGNVVLETKDWRCPYLGEDYRCTVYEDRPDVCRLYGNEQQINLTCQYQDKDGRIRSRQERRAVEREIGKMIKRFVKANEHKN